MIAKAVYQDTEETRGYREDRHIRPIDLNERVRALRAAAPFRELAEEQLTQIAARSDLHRYERRSIIVRGECPRQAFHIILAGHVKLCTGSGSVLAILGAGDCVGTLALAREAVETAAAIAMDEVRTVAVPGGVLRRTIVEYPDSALAILTSLTILCRAMCVQAAEMVHQDLRSRLARCLIELATRHGHDQGDGLIAIDAPVTQKELASLVGGSRESVNKLVSDLVRSGALERHRRRMAVKDSTLLREWINSPAMSRRVLMPSVAVS